MRRLPLRSPPRMRGKVGHSAPSPPTYRITPAYAGKSRCNLPSTAPWKDHPRVCGEKPLQSSVNCTMEGSPPRMRGKAVAIFRQLHHGRITPAYAGKRTSTHGMDVRSGDHPRVCGEKFWFTFVVNYSQGSPPRMRGKVSHLSIGAHLKGITPAYAGKSRRLSHCRSQFWDHPRVCGEKLA